MKTHLIGGALPERMNTIRFRLWAGFAIVILIATVLMAGSFYLVVNRTAVADATALLDTALTTAWSQFQVRPVQLKGTLQEAARSVRLQDALSARRPDGLRPWINDWQRSYPFVDFWTITDTDGTVLCRSGPTGSGDRWSLANLVTAAGQVALPITSTERFPEAALARESPDLAAKATITLQQPPGEPTADPQTFRDGLVTVVLAPVIGPSGKVLGVLAGGILLNHDTWIPDQYTLQVPNTYLSIGVQGVRIASNIETPQLSRPQGSVQEKALIEATRQGKPYRGILVVDGKRSLISDVPIRNYEGTVVGNIGVGAPIDMFDVYKEQSVRVVFLVCFLVFGVALILAEFVGARIVDPIYRLNAMARAISQADAGPEVMKWDSAHAPREIRELAHSMIAMAQGLKQKEQEAHTYARDLAEEKEQLEGKIQERTRELSHTVAQLEMTNKYKSQFLANMSHELRTPLNAIIGFSQLLKDQVAGDLTPKQQRYTHNILESANHLLELINDILDLVKIEQGKENFQPGYLSVRQTVDTITLLLGHQAANRQLRLTVEVQGDLPDPLWDRKKVKQILSNLVSNAIKFTPEGGEVHVSALKQGDGILLTVRDNGIGIRPEDHERVFLAFEQAQSSYTREFEGAGLGLAISKRLVELHNGRIWLESAPGAGTTVFVWLPISPFTTSDEGRFKDDRPAQDPDR